MDILKKSTLTQKKMLTMQGKGEESHFFPPSLPPSLSTLLKFFFLMGLDWR